MALAITWGFFSPLRKSSFLSLSYTVIMASYNQHESDRTISIISILSDTPDPEMQSTTSSSFWPLHPSTPSRTLPPHTGGAFPPPFLSFRNRLFHLPLSVHRTVPSPSSPLVIISPGDSSKASTSSVPSLQAAPIRGMT